jgi:hypothetical protein
VSIDLGPKPIDIIQKSEQRVTVSQHGFWLRGVQP